jgi:hypothetical protein
VRTTNGAATVRLALMRDDNRLVYVTYARTNERDEHGRTIYR